MEEEEEEGGWEWTRLREAGPVEVGIATGPKMEAGPEVEWKQGENADGLGRFLMGWRKLMGRKQREAQ